MSGQTTRQGVIRTRATIATVATAAALIGGGLLVFNRTWPSDEPTPSAKPTEKRRSVRSDPVQPDGSSTIDRVVISATFSNLPPTAKGYVYPWGDARKGDRVTFQLLADGAVYHSQQVTLAGPPNGLRVVGPPMALAMFLGRGWSARLVREKWNYKGTTPAWAQTINGIIDVEWRAQ
jgi:hypothetical protein